MPYCLEEKRTSPGSNHKEQGSSSEVPARVSHRSGGGSHRGDVFTGTNSSETSPQAQGLCGRGLFLRKGEWPLQAPCPNLPKFPTFDCRAAQSGDCFYGTSMCLTVLSASFKCKCLFSTQHFFWQPRLSGSEQPKQLSLQPHKMRFSFGKGQEDVCSL